MVENLLGEFQGGKKNKSGVKQQKHTINSNISVEHVK